MTVRAQLNLRRAALEEARQERTWPGGLPEGQGWRREGAQDPLGGEMETLLTLTVRGGVCACVHSLSHVQLFATPWTVARQAPLSMGFSRHKYWSGVPCPPPGDLPDPGIEFQSPALRADSFPAEPAGWLRMSKLGTYVH